MSLKHIEQVLRSCKTRDQVNVWYIWAADLALKEAIPGLNYHTVALARYDAFDYLARLYKIRRENAEADYRSIEKTFFAHEKRLRSVPVHQ